MRELKFESLHNHTLISDGTQVHVQALEAAAAAGIGVMAFTDHDALPDAELMRGLREYDGPVHWTVGVELSSYVPKEVGGPGMGALHVLGLFVDLENRGLRDFCERAEHSRLIRMRHLLAHLHDLGFEVSESEVVAQATSKNIVLPHIVKAVMVREQNRRLLDIIRERMQHEAEHDAELKKKYADMIAEGAQQYPYALVLTRHAYLPPAQEEMTALLDLDATVRLIREAGGVAMLAHWYYDERKISEQQLAAVLERGGLDGLETVTVNTIGERDMGPEMERARVLAERLGAASVMGSDSHTPADLQAFAASRYAAQSVGQTARLIERFRPDLRWSNLG